MAELVEALNGMISEYLGAQGFSETAATFINEAKTKTPAAIPSASEPSGAVHQEFLELMDCGERQIFFQLWEEHVPSAIRSSNVLCQHLECNISVYFAVFPIRTGVGDRESSMREFRSYLDSRGPVISRNQELAAYFALPYIPDPSNHPSFCSLFKKSWVQEVRSQLVQFLKEVLPPPPPTPPGPALLSMYTKFKRRSGGDAESEHAQKLSEIQVAYHTLCGITMELVGALEASVAGQQIDPEFIAGVCSRLMEGSQRQSLVVHSQPMQQQLVPASLPPRPSTSTLRASLITLRQSVGGRGIAEEEYRPLDFSKIKKMLHTGTSSQQALLLQALRWRLTRASVLERERAMQSYMTNDLLECRGHTHSILPLLSSLNSQHVAVREQVARLFNAFSSLSSGRGYLVEATPIVLALLNLLYGERLEDTATRRNALGAVQKLSLRRSVSRVMIKHDIVRWVVQDVLPEQDPASNYTLRYSLALLMNISLRALGRSHCAAYGHQLLEALAGLLEHEEDEVCEYVNGTLYSLLASPVLQQIAKEIGLEEVLREVFQRSSLEKQKQLHWILEQLHQQLTDDMEDSGDEGNETDVDAESDPELIEGDEGEVVLGSKVPRGEELLIKSYLLDNSSSDSSASTTDAHNLQETAAQQPTPAVAPPTSTDRSSTATLSQQPSLERSTPSGVEGSEALPPIIRPVTPLSYRPRNSAGPPKTSEPGDSAQARKLSSAT